MRITRRWFLSGLAATSVGSVALTGCQTYPANFGGLTLPSPHYLEHYPQYFPPDPPFPLQRELDSMQDPEGLMRPGQPRGADPLPPPVPLAPPQPVEPVPMDDGF